MTLLRETLRALPDATFADVYEAEDAYLIVLDAPGITAEGLTVRGDRATVEIQADRESEGPEGYRAVSLEREERLEATLPLPPDAHGEGVAWALNRGVLELTIPRGDVLEGTERPGTPAADESESKEMG